MGLVYLINRFNPKLIFIPTIALFLFTVFMFYQANVTPDLGALGYIIFGLVSASTTLFVFIFSLLLKLGVIFKKKEKK
jgi:hypothetical protein